MPTGTNVICDQLSTPVVGTDFTYVAGTGIVTFNTTGVYELIYGVSTGGVPADGGTFAAVLNGATVLAASEYSRLFLTGDVSMPTVALIFSATAADTLAIQNVGATINLGSGNPVSIDAFLVLKRVA